MRKIYKTFEEAAAALGIKVKKPSKKSQDTKECPNCGSELRHIEGTNVWMCDMASLQDDALKDGTPVQVFTRCKNVVFAKD